VLESISQSMTQLSSILMTQDDNREHDGDYSDDNQQLAFNDPKDVLLGALDSTDQGMEYNYINGSESFAAVLSQIKLRSPCETRLGLLPSACAARRDNLKKDLTVSLIFDF